MEEAEEVEEEEEVKKVEETLEEKKVLKAGKKAGGISYQDCRRMDKEVK